VYYYKKLSVVFAGYLLVTTQLHAPHPADQNRGL